MCLFFLREGEGACSVVRECTRFLSLTRTRYLIARDKGGGSMGKVFFFYRGKYFYLLEGKECSHPCFFFNHEDSGNHPGKVSFLGIWKRMLFKLSIFWLGWLV